MLRNSIEGLEVKDIEELLDLSDTAKDKVTELGNWFPAQKRPKDIKDYSQDVKFREK